MKPKTFWITLLRIIAVGCIGAALWLAYTRYNDFNQEQAVYSPGSMIADIPVGGLTQSQAIDRLSQAYNVPVELHYGKAVIQVQPSELGFELQLSEMIAQVEIQRSQKSWEQGFWDFLWNKTTSGPVTVPLIAKVDDQRIRAYFKDEISTRYDQAPTEAMPVAGSTIFLPGTPGTTINIEPAVPLINQALRSLTNRTVELTSQTVSALPPSMKNLQVLLQQNINLSQFGGITELYLLDLKTKQEIHFAYQNGKLIPADIAFTAASTIKVAIMTSIFRHLNEPTPQDVLDKMAKMIEVSENDPADELMAEVLDKNNGPLEMTKDIQALGLKNTFLAGYFYPGAPLLKRFTTPANQRKDYFTDPDPYNQTTPAEIGKLLGDIYYCAQNGSGPLFDVFSGQVSQNECKQMIDMLFGNKMPMLLAAGTPDGVKIAHKHGWIEELDGVVHTYSDVSIVFTPGGDYVLTAYMWDKKQLLFDTANQLMADLSRTVYNYFNIPAK